MIKYLTCVQFAAPYADWMIEYTEDRAREREERDNVRYGEYVWGLKMSQGDPLY